MKKTVLLIFGFILSVSVNSQYSEFEIYPNGLIYSEKTMSKLTHIVDSLNLEFQSCDFNTTFYSKSQAVGHLIRLEEGNIKAAIKDMKQQISLDKFLEKYPQATIERDVLVIKSKSKDYENRDYIRFEHFDLEGDYGFQIRMDDVSYYQKDLTNKWLLKYNEKWKYSDESVAAFYFPENFSSVPIPQKYAEMIGYSDCLIDTATTKFKEKLKDGRIDLPRNWSSFSIKRKEKLLDELRSTRVVGTCSQDSGPRNHAVNIALLSADTYNWGVFLKSHLDIMNDRFDRMSDGSYAWGARNTYIKELEELKIDVPDLMFGISFRIENPVPNHYYGSIGRLGRALSETKNRNEIEQRMLSVISDKDLDLYNRLLFYFLFRNYNYFIEDEQLNSENNEKLNSAAESFPDFISEKLREL